jgi:hypothetical protein
VRVILLAVDLESRLDLMATNQALHKGVKMTLSHSQSSRLNGLMAGICNCRSLAPAQVGEALGISARCLPTTPVDRDWSFSDAAVVVHAMGEFYGVELFCLWQFVFENTSLPDVVFSEPDNGTSDAQRKFL